MVQIGGPYQIISRVTRKSRRHGKKSRSISESDQKHRIQGPLAVYQVLARSFPKLAHHSKSAKHESTKSRPFSETWELEYPWHGPGDIMKLLRRQFLQLAAGAAALPTVSRIAWAQTYPMRPAHIIVGFPAGGPQ